MFEPISFKDLRESTEYSDCNSIVWTALIPGNTEDELSQMTEFFHKMNLLPKDASVIDERFITGNVNGDEGRSDVLLVLTPTNVNPIVRLSMSELKWTSDFIENFKSDYNY